MAADLRLTGEGRKPGLSKVLSISYLHFFGIQENPLSGPQAESLNNLYSLVSWHVLPKSVKAASQVDWNLLTCWHVFNYQSNAELTNSHAGFSSIICRHTHTHTYTNNLTVCEGCFIQGTILIAPKTLTHTHSLHSYTSTCFQSKVSHSQLGIFIFTFPYWFMAYMGGGKGKSATREREKRLKKVEIVYLILQVT